MKQPFVVAYGMGVDSTAMLIGLSEIGMRPDRILFADVGGEKDETYAYQAIMDQFLESVGFPAITVVRYVPQDFKNWPPYHTLEENCLTNGTLPSLAFGFGSCSQNWKAAPQNQFCNAWEPAIKWWAQGGRVLKAIGFDASPADVRRRNHAGNQDDPKYEFWYPLYAEVDVMPNRAAIVSLCQPMVDRAPHNRHSDSSQARMSGFACQTAHPSSPCVLSEGEEPRGIEADGGLPVLLSFQMTEVSNNRRPQPAQARTLADLGPRIEVRHEEILLWNIVSHHRRISS